MDSQDTLALAEVMEDNITVEEETERLVIFFALKHYLTHLTGNGGSLNRIIVVTKMLENRMEEIKEYANNFLVDKMKGE